MPPCTGSLRATTKMLEEIQKMIKKESFNGDDIQMTPKPTAAPRPLCTAPPPDHEVHCPPTPKQAIAIKNLRMIANDIENGADSFNFLLDYDFCNLPFDIAEGEKRREQVSEKEKYI